MAELVVPLREVVPLAVMDLVLVEAQPEKGSLPGRGCSSVAELAVPPREVVPPAAMNLVLVEAQPEMALLQLGDCSSAAEQEVPSPEVVPPAAMDLVLVEAQDEMVLLQQVGVWDYWGNWSVDWLKNQERSQADWWAQALGSYLNYWLEVLSVQGLVEPSSQV